MTEPEKKTRHEHARDISIREAQAVLATIVGMPGFTATERITINQLQISLRRVVDILVVLRNLQVATDHTFPPSN